jgi:putative restriction endonuclease
MKVGQKLWTRDELILVINLYCKEPFGRLHSRNPEIIKLASFIGRTPGSVAFKLVNLASLDPTLKARGIKGASNVSNLDKAIWGEFLSGTESLAYESETLRARFEGTSVVRLNNISEDELPKQGMERETLVKIRVNQSFFRAAILASYDFTCCISGLKHPKLLVAGHIRPWGVDHQNRLNLRNGFCMNGLHDKAFEEGLITVTPDYRVRISSVLKKEKSEVAQRYFLKYENKQIILPKRFLPDPEFLKYHNNERFKP